MNKENENIEIKNNIGIGQLAEDFVQGIKDGKFTRMVLIDDIGENDLKIAPIEKALNNFDLWIKDAMR